MTNKTFRFRTGTSLILLVVSAHFIHDVFTSFVAPLLPLLITKLDITLFQASTLPVFLTIPSVFNPLLGSFVDRSQLHRLFVAIGPAGSGTLMGLMGIAPNFAVLSVILLSAGVAASCIHVTAPVLIHHISPKRVGRGMGWFMVAGELARTIGPLIAVQFVSLYGLNGLWKLIPVAIGSSVILWWKLGTIAIVRSETPPIPIFTLWRKMGKLLLTITGIMASRAFLVGCLTTFLPTFLYSEGQSLWRANIALSILELFGAMGAFVSGTFSDKLGRRIIIAFSLGMSPVLMLLFLHTSGLPQLIILGFLGLTMLSTAPVIMAIVIENSGSNKAAANGTYFMINFGVRAITLLAIGYLADNFGLRATYTWCAGIATIGIPLVLLLPSSVSTKQVD